MEGLEYSIYQKQWTPFINQGGNSYLRMEELTTLGGLVNIF